MIVEHSERLRMVLMFVILAFFLGVQVPAQTPNLQPEQGYVPDLPTAVKVADVILVSMFGEENVRDERPFTGVLKDGVWVVRGHTFDSPHPGGSVEIQISKKSGCILGVKRGK